MNITAVWLRTLLNEKPHSNQIEVLIEVNKRWYPIIVEPPDNCVSHVFECRNEKDLSNPLPFQLP